MRADDPTLPDRIHLRTLVEHGLAPMLKKEPMEILRGMLGEELPPEPVFVNLTAEQLERCIQAAQWALTPPSPPTTRSVESGEWLTEQQLAKHLAVSVRHLSNLRKAGLPFVKLGSSVRYSIREVEAYLRSNLRLSSGVRRRRAQVKARILNHETTGADHH
jgi:hypothetical protein